MGASQPSVNSSITGDTLIIIALTTLSNVVALFRESLFASRFGVGSIADSYIIAFSLCSSIFLLFSSGNIIFAYIPLSQDFTSKSSESRFLGTIFGFVLVISLGLSAFLSLNSFELISFVAPGASGRVASDASHIAKFISPIIVFSSIGAVFQAALNKHFKFVLPSAIPVLSNICFVAILIFGQNLPLISQIILATTSSYSIWLLLCIPVYRKLYFFRTPSLPSYSRTIKPFVLTLLPLCLITGIDQIVLIVQKYSLSFLPLGALSSVNYAYRVESIPVGLIAAAFSTAIFPRFSSYYSKNEFSKLTMVFNYGLESILIVAIPATALCITLSSPVIDLLFQRGSFSVEDTHRVARLFTFYSVGLLPQVLTVYFTRLYLASSSYKRLLFLASTTTILFIVLVISLPRIIGESGIPVATSLNAFFYTLLLSRSSRNIHEEASHRYHLKTTLMSALICFGLLIPLDFAFNSLPNLLRISTTILIFAPLYLLFLLLILKPKYFQLSTYKMQPLLSKIFRK